jgi:hypothetical protein
MRAPSLHAAASSKFASPGSLQDGPTPKRHTSRSAHPFCPLNTFYLLETTQCACTHKRGVDGSSAQTLLQMFPFGFSFEELFYAGAFLTIAGGYRASFLRYSRNGGVFVGRVVGFIRQKREQVFASSKQRAEMEALQSQLSDAMNQLNFIRHDIRSSTRAAYPAPSPSVPPEAGAGNARQSAHPPPGSQHVPSPAASQSADARPLPFAGASGPGQPHPDGSGRFDAADPMGAAMTQASPAGSPSPSLSGTATQTAAQRFQSLVVEDPSGRTVYIGGVPLIPVSAAAAGHAPAKRQGHLTGSHIAEEALREQEVAQRAAALLAGWPPPGKAGGGS